MKLTEMKHGEDVLFSKGINYSLPGSIMMGQMEEVVRQILQQILKREPIPEDASRLTLLYRNGEIQNMDVAYDGVKIGRIVQTINGVECKTTFHPDKSFT